MKQSLASAGSGRRDESRVAGCLIGGAVGDALGLPCEGLSRRRQERLFPDLVGHRFLLGRGMVSDDTDHACMTAQAVLASARDSNRFAASLAWQLKLWLLGLPAGVGFATLRSILKLWVGIPPSRSGVWSAGNGPAMRSPILGVAFAQDQNILQEFVRASTRLTHRDPRAEQGALALAVAAAMAASATEDIAPEEYSRAIHAALGADAAPDLVAMLDTAIASAAVDQCCNEYLSSLGMRHGVSGFINHTAAAVIQVWLRHQSDYAGGVLEMIRCGGDTDTTGAILGGLIGARVGRDGIPREWVNGLAEWPRSISWINRLAARLAAGDDRGPQRIQAWAIPLRNLVFMVVVLLHGLRRLFPPY